MGVPADADFLASATHSQLIDLHAFLFEASACFNCDQVQNSKLCFASKTRHEAPLENTIFIHNSEHEIISLITDQSGLCFTISLEVLRYERQILLAEFFWTFIDVVN